jgi:glycosyltransferase involved in cell wall biosynthesis
MLADTLSAMEPASAPRVTVVLPARDEAGAVGAVVEGAHAALTSAGISHEVLVVDDGSTDGTGEAAKAAGARVVRHPLGLGNGAAVKAGIRAARGEIVAMLDADGQHDPADLPRLLSGIDEGYAMVVGARTGGFGAGVHRALANRVYATLASWVASTRIPDLTSGYRVVRTKEARRFLYLLPNTFSYPSTLTLALLRSGHPVKFEPVRARARTGRSKIRVLKDGARFLLIILRIATLYSPLRVFLPASVASFLLGAGIYGFTWWSEGAPRFTNGMQLCLLLGTALFFVALVSEQVAALRFDRSEDDARA